MSDFRRRLVAHNQRGVQLENSAARMTISTCRVKVNNAGEATAPFIFACRYSQLPSMTFGFQMQSEPPDGRKPLFSASVKEWHTIDRLPGSRLYVGATILIICESTEDVSFVCNATATGIAFSGPVS